jgi:arylsulfatase A-like enzyme
LSRRSRTGAGLGVAHRLGNPAALGFFGFVATLWVFGAAGCGDRATKPTAGAVSSGNVEVLDLVAPLSAAIASQAVAATPAADAAKSDRVTIAPRSEVDLWLDVPVGARLRFDRLATRGDQAVLELSVERDGEAPRSLARWSAASADWSTELAPGPARFRFANPSAATWVLVRPRVESPAASREEAAAGAPPSAPRLNVLIYLVDTLRADHLGAYGYGRATSPAIDSFASRSIVFERAQAQSSWTRPTVASILTGLEAWRHGANHRNEALADDHDTLAERFAAAGYRTGAVVTNPNVARSYGFAQGFETFQRLGGGRNGSAEVATVAAEWLAAANDARPFFLYLHTVDPHAPYRPPPPFLERFGALPDRLEVGSLAFLRRLGLEQEPVTPAIVRQLIDLYDAEVAENDEGFGKVLAELERRGLSSSTVVVLIADHGEEFHEHGGFEHGHTLYQDQLHVPLVVHVPGVAGGKRVARPVQQVDVFATALDLAGVALPAAGDGVSLKGLFEGGVAVGGEPVRELVATMDVDQVAKSSILRWPWKLVRHDKGPRAGERELFDLDSDPGETVDRSAERAFLADYLDARLAARLRSTGKVRSVVSEDEELRKDLKALGYIQ